MWMLIILTRVIKEFDHIERLLRNAVLFEGLPELVMDGGHERATSAFPLFLVANLAQSRLGVHKRGLVRDAAAFVIVWVESNHDDWTVTEVLEKFHRPSVLAGLVVRLVLVLIDLDDEHVCKQVKVHVRSPPATAHSLVNRAVENRRTMSGKSWVEVLFYDVNDGLFLHFVISREGSFGEEMDVASEAEAFVLCMYNCVTPR